MKPASFLLSVLVSAPLLLASTVALAAPGDKAPKKKGGKANSSVAAKGPKKTDKAEKAEPAPEPVAPETKAADAKAPEVAPVPVASTSASSAGADRPSDRRHRDDDVDETGKFAIAPLLGYGSNYLGLAVGARAGYTFPNKVYVGGTFMYHFGASYGGYGLGDFGYNVMYPAGEVGYDFHVGPVTIRPMLGAGIGFTTVSSSYLGRDDSNTATSLVIYPGATAHWNIPRSNFFVGGDTRALIMTGGGGDSRYSYGTASALSFGFNATAGLKF